MDTNIELNNSAAEISSSKNYVRDFFSVTKEILLEPAQFFRSHFASYDLYQALCFGLVSLWLSSMISFIWDSLNQVFIVRFFEHWIQDILLQEESISFLQFGGKSFIMAAGYVLLNPFSSLFGLALSSFLLFTLAKLFIPMQERAREKIQYSTIMKILAFASTGAWLVIVPFFGGILSFIAISLLTVIGVRECYGSSTRRSAFVVFLPHILLIVFAMMLLFLAVVGFVSMMNLPWDSIAEMQGY